ncbi:hypothetical protein K5D56_05130 [Pseudomonas cichorii]|nr:hypothetical protein [Pseudomonas cichorii]MBX8519515.1 hypothetical protein [Pseudomonas cichorii]MBX8549477.1 hypothetical protein [Pseudomonas cichorii]MBX8564246.1 hypothetical protein [Pseudomonas cichorii]MBX8584455.1 hypothetical protein [Pseudomonas cichorii]MBX8588755.1 hypothetical protein [Pseudomonas cichorii]
MNSFVRNLAMVMLVGLSGIGVAQAQDQPGRNGATSNPYNSPIHRSNPNSRQGTQPSTPQVQPNIVPAPRQPTLENGGIRNGYPTRQPSSPSPTIQNNQNTTPKRP